MIAEALEYRKRAIVTDYATSMLRLLAQHTKNEVMQEALMAHQQPSMDGWLAVNPNLSSSVWDKLINRALIGEGTEVDKLLKFHRVVKPATLDKILRWSWDTEVPAWRWQYSIIKRCLVDVTDSQALSVLAAPWFTAECAGEWLSAYMNSGNSNPSEEFVRLIFHSSNMRDLSNAELILQGFLMKKKEIASRPVDLKSDRFSETNEISAGEEFLTNWEVLLSKEEPPPLTVEEIVDDFNSNLVTPLFDKWIIPVLEPAGLTGCGLFLNMLHGWDLSIFELVTVVLHLQSEESSIQISK